MAEQEFNKPEEHELAIKRQELVVLEQELSVRERELEGMQASIGQFERQSRAELEPRYEELGTLRAQITELLARFHSSDAQRVAKPQATVAPVKKAARPAVKRLGRARPEKPEKVGERPLPESTPKELAERLKRLYRDVAKAVHPDFSDNDLERQHRHTLMVRANEAYDSGDEVRLNALLHEWESSPEAIRGQGAVPDLIRAIRRIHRVRMRLAEIAVEVHRLSTTSAFGLKSMADAAQQFERDLLTEMTSRMDAQIAEAKEQLKYLQERAAKELPAPPPTPQTYEPVYVQTFPGETGAGEEER
jgi:hypothetical protein